MPGRMASLVVTVMEVGVHLIDARGGGGRIQILVHRYLDTSGCGMGGADRGRGPAMTTLGLTPEHWRTQDPAGPGRVPPPDPRRVKASGTTHTDLFGVSPIIAC